MVGSEMNSDFEEPQVTNLSKTQAANVNAQQVHMNQAAAENVTADTVEVEQGAIGDLNANQVTADRSVLGEVKASDVFANQSLIGFVQAERAAVSGFAGAVIGQSADVHNSAAAVVIANDVKFGESARTVLLISNNVQGTVTTLMDTRKALIAGLVAGLFASISLLLGQALFRRR